MRRVLCIRAVRAHRRASFRMSAFKARCNRPLQIGSLSKVSWTPPHTHYLSCAARPYGQRAWLAFRQDRKWPGPTLQHVRRRGSPSFQSAKLPTPTISWASASRVVCDHASGVSGAKYTRSWQGGGFGYVAWATLPMPHPHKAVSLCKAPALFCGMLRCCCCSSPGHASNLQGCQPRPRLPRGSSRKACAPPRTSRRSLRASRKPEAS